MFLNIFYLHRQYFLGGRPTVQKILRA